VVADVLNLSKRRRPRLVTFYHDFRRTPPGRAPGPALPRRGLPVGRRERKLYAAAARAAYAEDDDVEVSEVFCLGNCALGPVGPRRRHASSDGSPRSASRCARSGEARP
jgi:formate dehydrogenase subunit gamma